MSRGGRGIRRGQHRFVEEGVCFFGKDIGDILTLIASGRLASVAEGAIEVVVRIRVEEKILSK